MMTCIDEDGEKSSQTHQDDVGSGVSSTGQNIIETTVIQVEAKRLIQLDLIVMFFNVYSQTAEERSARYVSTSLFERGTPSSRSSRSGDHQRFRRDSLEYDRRDGRAVLRKY
ncbi:hypothetical protein Tco_0294907 [Tanacetum coccineum]